MRTVLTPTNPTLIHIVDFADSRSTAFCITKAHAIKGVALICICSVFAFYSDVSLRCTNILFVVSLASKGLGYVGYVKIISTSLLGHIDTTVQLSWSSPRETLRFMSKGYEVPCRSLIHLR